MMWKSIGNVGQHSVDGDHDEQQKGCTEDHCTVEEEEEDEDVKMENQSRGDQVKA